MGSRCRGERCDRCDSESWIVSKVVKACFVSLEKRAVCGLAVVKDCPRK